MESSKPFLMKHILDINEGHSSDPSDTKCQNDADVEDDASSQQDTSVLLQGQASAQAARRKIRRCFRAEQLEYLERCFMESIYPEASRRKKISQELKVSKERVQVWFQNRRAKARKQWKQQRCNLLSRASATRNGDGGRGSPVRVGIIPHSGVRQDHVNYARFPSSSFRYEHFRRELHISQQYERATTASAVACAPPPTFHGAAASSHFLQGAPPLTVCSCCPISPPPRSLALMKQYEQLSPHPTRVTMMPATPPGPQLCQCVPIRPQPKYR
eukprot:gene2984-3441_t